MSQANIFASAAFFGIFMLEILVLVLHDMLRNRPGPMIKQRMGHITALQNISRTVQLIDDTTDLFHHRHNHGFMRSWAAARVQRIRSVSGKAGVRLLMASWIFGLPAAAAIVLLTPLPFWAAPLVLLSLPILLAYFAYQSLIGRFRSRFLRTFPDTIDLVVRAVRSGIPVVQAISVAGEEADEPVRSEFRLMGDRLRLGVDMKDVLDAAVERIQIADFSFFSVCLLLQRETGGALTETLENLAAIIRARRDIRLKVHALTGEGRIASQIISAVPFFVISLLYFANHDYVMILFNTSSGRKLLIVAAILLLLGTILINKIANLDTSR